MLDIQLLILPLLAFLVALFATPIWIRKAHQIGLVWPDMNKINGDKVSGSGGVIVLLAFIVSVFGYMAYITFYLHETSYLVELFALTSVMLLLGGIGLVDDLLGWQRGGLSRRSRLILVALASVPLIAINAGKHTIAFPFIVTLDLGLIYPFVLIPIAIVGAATTFNFLAGFNGLEAGQGALLLAGIALVAYYTGSPWISVVCICMVAALLGFLIFNAYPAKVFPGDVMTYPIGGLIAMGAILGNFEKIALFFFIPVIIEVFLKARGKLVKQSFGLPRAGGSLDLKYDKIYGLTHLGIYLLKKWKIAPTEKRVVLLIWSFQLAVIILGLVLFRGSIF